MTCRHAMAFSWSVWLSWVIVEGLWDLKLSVPIQSLHLVLRSRYHTVFEWTASHNGNVSRCMYSMLFNACKLYGGEFTKRTYSTDCNLQAATCVHLGTLTRLIACSSKCSKHEWQLLIHQCITLSLSEMLNYSNVIGEKFTWCAII